MVFSSVPIFLDTPNWQQQQNHHQGNGANSFISSQEAHQNHQLPPLPSNPNPSHHAGAGGSSRPVGGSMAERARLAKIPHPEGTLKCPRCESTNTKFCYFNNYSLTQPRHFCKSCRRYWTRGGALRNVPVGGGCRRNKKGKNGNAKSSNGQSKQIITGSSSSGTMTSTAAITEGIISNDQFQQQTNNQFPFLTSLQHLSQFGNIGLNLSGISNNDQTQIGALNASSLINDLGFLQVGTGSTASGLSNNNENILTSGSGLSQFALFDPSTGLYPFQGGSNNIVDNNIGASSSSPSMAAKVSQVAPVKLEENHLLNLSRPIMGLTSSKNNNQYWAGASDFSGLNSSSTNNHFL